MLKERLAVANKLANEVHAAEAAIDNAIAKLGVLVTSLPDAQAGARLSAVVGDRAFAHLQSAVAGLFEGRSQVVALHNELASLKDRVGLRNMVVGSGDLGKVVPARATLAESDADTPRRPATRAA
ncbi:MULTISPECIES: hypothetical protein [Sphingopyxis]|uniref:Uncharacterized protein n=1 Tax=Sphingopyxis terrae subsp. ummariensis TaxID=429001 RepID=A0A1Y6FRP8_9SPHN|nr:MULTISPECIES: hypothetical protein [Sphingopyxis]KAB2854277.1 MAG: hypothetical protein F9K41_11625 [Sphingopyxis terrae]PCF91699.1 hypothetical protein CPA46_09715 [Sphingopyxis terrae subsp. ummariensis]SMQ76936.1 hypothetical protein SAMN06295984_2356 [Sphingopyxis terrae subsp. ummariensis]